MNTTKEQIELMMHALGGNYNNSYRNYYSTTPNSNADIQWKDLVIKNLAIKGKNNWNITPTNLYHVSSKGLMFLKSIKGNVNNV